MNMFRKLDEKFGNNAIWQFVKFNMVSMSITIVQLLLANLLPLVFDSMMSFSYFPIKFMSGCS